MRKQFLRKKKKASKMNVPLVHTHLTKINLTFCLRGYPGYAPIWGDQRYFFAAPVTKNHEKSQKITKSGMRITKNHKKSRKITKNHRKSQKTPRIW